MFPEPNKVHGWDKSLLTNVSALKTSTSITLPRTRQQMWGAGNPLNSSYSAFTAQGRGVTLNRTEAVSETAFKAESHPRRGASASLTLWHRDGERNVLFRDARRLAVPDREADWELGTAGNPPGLLGDAPERGSGESAQCGWCGGGGGLPEEPILGRCPSTWVSFPPIAPPPPLTAASVVSQLCACQHRHTPTLAGCRHVPHSQGCAHHRHLTTRQPTDSDGPAPRSTALSPGHRNPPIPAPSLHPRSHLAPGGLPEQVLWRVHLPWVWIARDLEAHGWGDSGGQADGMHVFIPTASQHPATGQRRVSEA